MTKDGDVYWGMQLIKDNEELVNRLKVIAVLTRNPRLHIRGDLAGVTSSSDGWCSRRSAPAFRRSGLSPNHHRVADRRRRWR